MFLTICKIEMRLKCSMNHEDEIWKDWWQYSLDLTKHISLNK